MKVAMVATRRLGRATGPFKHPSVSPRVPEVELQLDVGFLGFTLAQNWRSGFVWKCRLNPKKPNGFADHYPYYSWLFHWGFGPHFQTDPSETWTYFSMWLWLTARIWPKLAPLHNDCWPGISTRAPVSPSQWSWSHWHGFLYNPTTPENPMVHHCIIISSEKWVLHFVVDTFFQIFPDLSRSFQIWLRKCHQKHGQLAIAPWVQRGLPGGIGLDPWHTCKPRSGRIKPSGYVKIAMENGYRNSGFSH